MPLTSPVNQNATRCCPFDQTFNVIILCMILFTVSVTIALTVHIVVFEYQGPHRHGALVTESGCCGAIGVGILKDGGSAVDAAIAVQICLGVVSPHLTGIGGGGFMSIYRNGARTETTIIDFRAEMASESVGLGHSSELRVDKNATSVAIPGLVSGLALAHRLYGKLPWARLVEPSVALAANGFRVGRSLHDALQRSHSAILVDPLFKDVFVPNGTIASVGDWARWTTLSETLAIIARDGPQSFYDSRLADSIVQDLTEAGAMLTAEDFRNYSAKSHPPLEIAFRGLQLVVPPAPSAGPSFLLMVKLIEALWDSLQQMDADLRYDTLIRVIKVASAAVAESDRRSHTWFTNGTTDDLLGEENVKKLISIYFGNNRSSPAFSRELVEIRPPFAAASIIASDSEELFVAAITGLGSPFGSGIITSSGVILNDAYKHTCDARFCRPPSTMLPVILREKGTLCGPLLVAASADYQMLAQVMARIDPQLPIQSAVDWPRLRVAFDEAQGDVGIDSNDSGWTAILLDGLKHHGHTIFRADDVVSSVVALRTLGDSLEVYIDSKPEGFHEVF